LRNFLQVKFNLRSRSSRVWWAVCTKLQLYSLQRFDLQLLATTVYFYFFQNKNYVSNYFLKNQEAFLKFIF
jgi:hypothetical protein